MKKLELSHVAKRLPYGLKIWNTEMLVDFSLTIQEQDGNTVDLETAIEYSDVWMPILRPLSDLTKEITVNIEKFVPLTEICDLEIYGYAEFRDMVKNNNFFSGESLTYQLVQKLIEWHFDLPSENLIEQGLAISVFELKENPYA